MSIQGRKHLPLLAAFLLIGLRPSVPAASQRSGPDGALVRVQSKDGTLIAVECEGSGPSLVIVHGGVGDRTRWTPRFVAGSSRSHSGRQQLAEAITKFLLDTRDRPQDE